MHLIGTFGETHTHTRTHAKRYGKWGNMYVTTIYKVFFFIKKKTTKKLEVFYNF